MECYEPQRWQKLGHQILSEVEDLLGKRQPCHFVGFFEGEKEEPYFDYYDPAFFETSVIYLTKGLTKASHAAFEISHEVIHLLTPVKGSEVTNFEEGLATFFSFYYLLANGKVEYFEQKREDAQLTKLNYFEAYQSVKDVPDLFERIKWIRIKEPEIKISKFGHGHFKELTKNRDLIYYWSNIFKYEE